MQISDPVVIALIGGLAGLLSGAVASVIAPWVNWGVEKRRRKLEYRSGLIQRWRMVLAHPTFDRNHMLREADFGALEPLLSDTARSQMLRPNSSHIIVVGGTGEANEADRNLLQREIARIEREWGLV